MIKVDGPIVWGAIPVAGVVTAVAGIHAYAVGTMGSAHPVGRSSQAGGDPAFPVVVISARRARPTRSPLSDEGAPLGRHAARERTRVLRWGM